MLSILMALAISAATTPDTATSAPAAAQTPAKPKLVCKTVAETGSRFTKRVCYTEAELEAKEHEDQSAVRRAQRPGGFEGH